MTFLMMDGWTHRNLESMDGRWLGPQKDDDRTFKSIRRWHFESSPPPYVILLGFSFPETVTSIASSVVVRYNAVGSYERVTTQHCTDVAPMQVLSVIRALLAVRWWVDLRKFRDSQSQVW